MSEPAIARASWAILKRGLTEAVYDSKLIPDLTLPIDVMISPLCRAEAVLFYTPPHLQHVPPARREHRPDSGAYKS